MPTLTLRERILEPVLQARRALFAATGIESDIEVTLDAAVFDDLVAELELVGLGLRSRNRQSLHVHPRVVFHRRGL